METIKKVKVSNMESSKGNIVPNQFIIETEEGNYFQSYNSIIAAKLFDSKSIFLDEHYWDYSVTTGKYRNQFLSENKAITKSKIASGEYVLANLN